MKPQSQERCDYSTFSSIALLVSEAIACLKAGTNESDEASSNNLEDFKAGVRAKALTPLCAPRVSERARALPVDRACCFTMSLSASRSAAKRVPISVVLRGFYDGDQLRALDAQNKAQVQAEWGSGAE